MKRINRAVLHLLILSLSAIMLGVGCVCFIQANFGSDAMTTLMNGMEKCLHLTLSQCNLVLNTFLIVVAFLMDRKQIGVGSIIYPWFSSQGITLGMRLLPEFHGYVRAFGFICGIILLSLAIALASKTDYGKNPYDAMCFAIMDKIQKKYNVVRSGMDALMLLLGISMHATFGIGTLVSVLSIGTVAMLLMNIMDKWNWLIISLDKGGIKI